VSVAQGALTSLTGQKLVAATLKRDHDLNLVFGNGKRLRAVASHRISIAGRVVAGSDDDVASARPVASALEGETVREVRLLPRGAVELTFASGSVRLSPHSRARPSAILEVAEGARFALKGDWSAASAEYSARKTSGPELTTSPSTLKGCIVSGFEPYRADGLTLLAEPSEGDGARKALVFDAAWCWRMELGERVLVGWRDRGAVHHRVFDDVRGRRIVSWSEPTSWERELGFGGGYVLRAYMLASAAWLIVEDD